MLNSFILKVRRTKQEDQNGNKTKGVSMKKLVSAVVVGMLSLSSVMAGENKVTACDIKTKGLGLQSTRAQSDSASVEAAKKVAAQTTETGTV